MKTALEQQVLETIRRHRMALPGDRIGAAVSGGGDSVALLRILEGLRQELGITLRVIHFNHLLRGKESDSDAAFVENLARVSGLEFLLERQDVAQEAKRRHWNLEDAARRLRLAFFERLVNEGRVTRVAVAHTADDQAETVLARLLRGTGPRGLAGIYPVSGPVVRPLLWTRRSVLRGFLRERDESWREDPTNRDLRRQRARLREQLLPLLERDFSRDIVAHLAGLAELAREEQDFWGALVEERFQAIARRRGEALVVGIEKLLSPMGPALGTLLPRSATGLLGPWRALTERLIRRVYEDLRGDTREMTATHVEQVIHLASASSSGHRAELPGRIVVERRFDELFFSHVGAEERRASKSEPVVATRLYQYVVQLPERGAATVSVPELGRRFSLKVIDWPLPERDTKSEGQALDGDLLRAPLILRNWRPGDAYRPRGRRQARKLKQMFLAGRVPGPERARWPVLESDGRVVWARGMPPAEEVSARKGTRVGVVIEEDQL